MQKHFVASFLDPGASVVEIDKISVLVNTGNALIISTPYQIVWIYKLTFGFFLLPQFGMSGSQPEGRPSTGIQYEEKRRGNACEILLLLLIGLSGSLRLRRVSANPKKSYFWLPARRKSTETKSSFCSEAIVATTSKSAVFRLVLIEIWKAVTNQTERLYGGIHNVIVIILSNSEMR